MMSGEAMKAAIAALEGELSGASSSATSWARWYRHRQGDIHEIGKTLVATMLAANGFEVHDLGVDVPARAFVDRCGRWMPTSWVSRPC